MHRRVLPLIAASVVALLLVIPGVAEASGIDDGDDAEAVPISVESGAAVEAQPPDVIDDSQPWTVRYIFPLLVALSVVVIGGIGVLYLVRVKGRYQVVQSP
jgi:hypothetical protein